MTMQKECSACRKCLRQLCMGVCVLLSLVSTAGAEVLSSGLSLYADPEGDPRWNIIGNGCAVVELPWPEHAVSASVVVSNLLTGRSQTIECADRLSSIPFTVPADASEESVYRLTATFSFESHKRATVESVCVAVRGMNSDHVSFVATESNAPIWRKTAKTAVLPTYASTDIVTRDGEELPAYGFWRGLTRIPQGDTCVALGACDRTLTYQAGFMLIFR